MIEWNKITWYSKLLAIIFFIGVLPAWTFYLGSQYGEVKNIYSQQNMFSIPVSATPIIAVQKETDTLPTAIGKCSTTTITAIANRLQDGENGPPIPGSGSVVEYSNGGSQVSYDQVKEVDASHIGDKVNLCLTFIPDPKECPPGDLRGREYKATNLRTNESWTLPDSQHMCGGA